MYTILFDKNKSDWMEQNFNLIYQTSFENYSFLELQKYCTDLISKEPTKILNLPNFSLIPEKLLITLIQNDNVQMDVVQVWKHVLKWGIAQNPELSLDPSTYLKEDFNTLSIMYQIGTLICKFLVNMIFIVIFLLFVIF